MPVVYIGQYFQHKPSFLFFSVCHKLFYIRQNVLEIHDQLAAQIANSREEVEYIDGVSSIEEDDEDDAKTVTSAQPEKKDKDDKKKDEEEVQVDTYRVIGIRRQPGECLVSIQR